MKSARIPVEDLVRVYGHEHWKCPICLSELRLAMDSSPICIKCGSVMICNNIESDPVPGLAMGAKLDLTKLN